MRVMRARIRRDRKADSRLHDFFRPYGPGVNDRQESERNQVPPLETGGGLMAPLDMHPGTGRNHPMEPLRVRSDLRITE